MNAKLLGTSMLLGIMAMSTGCSRWGAAWEGARIGKNLAKRDSYLRIYLNGQEAKQSKLKKGYFGYAAYKCTKPVSKDVTFRFEFIDEAKFGRVTGSSMRIHKEFAAGKSDLAEFTITQRTSGSEGALRPGTDYLLSAIGSQCRVVDFNNNEVGGVTLEPGLEYLLVFTITGDRSESVQVLFETK